MVVTKFNAIERQHRNAFVVERHKFGLRVDIDGLDFDAEIRCQRFERRV